MSIKWRRIESGYYTAEIDGEEWWIVGPAGTLADGLRPAKYVVQRGPEFSAANVTWCDDLATAKERVARLTERMT